jgi:tripartite-type tricarboxylate transporter receptor subunit TctC
MAMELFKQMAKIDMTHIPYKGTAPSLTGILSGEVQVMFGGSINTTPMVKSGKLRALAVAGDRRAKALPDVPTVAESGFPGYEANTWNGMLAPAGTPRAIVLRLNKEMLKILGTREVIDYMTADGAEPAGGTPDEFAAYLRSEHAKWAKVIRDAKISKSN